MYKLTQLDGTDFYSGTINYADKIGKMVRIKDYDPPPAVCGKGQYASRNPNDCFAEANIPCRAFKVQGIQKISGDSKECCYQALKVLDEIHDLDTLFGWKYSEAINPINPFKIIPPNITDEHISLLKQWASVRDSVWYSVGDSVGVSVRTSVWDFMWYFMGSSMWSSIYDSVWRFWRGSVRDSVWDSMGSSLWNSVWASVRESMWAYIGSLFPNIKTWKGMKSQPDVYPFQPAVDLWKQGLVPSYDGKTWRLHGGPSGEILYEDIREAKPED